MQPYLAKALSCTFCGCYHNIEAPPVGLFRLLPLLLAVWLAGCAIPGSDAFQQYQSSYDAARQAADHVVEVYNQYDKLNRKRRTSSATFNPDFADVYSAEALSPLSAKIAEGFAAATVYNEVLARYVTNNTLSLHAEEIARLNAAAASAAAIVGQPQAAGQINAVINATLQLVNLSLATADRADFVRNVQANSDAVDAFLVTVRADTSAMFSDARAATALDNGSVEKLEEFRKMLAVWVLLTDQTRADLATLQRSVAAGNAGRPVVGLLAESASRIDRYARDIMAARTELLAVF